MTAAMPINTNGQGALEGRGRFARFTFSGNGAVEVVLERASNTITVAVPPGSISGPFGFTIAGRSENYKYAFPTADAFEAFSVDFPGFRVTGQERSHP